MMNLTLQNVLQEATTQHTTLYVLVLAFAVNYVFFSSLGIFKKKRYPNGPWGFPILGHLPLLGKNPPETFDKWRKQFGDVYRIRMGSWKTIIINGYKAVKEAANRDDDFSNRPAFVSQKIMFDIYGEHSLGLEPFDQSYLEHRKFTAAALRKFTSRSGNVIDDMIIEEANALVKRLISESCSGPRDIRPDIQYTVGSLIFRFLYGTGKEIDVHTQLKTIIRSTEEFIEFMDSGNPFDVMPWLRYIMPWKVNQLTNAMAATDSIRREQVKEHFETFSKENINDITDAFFAADMEGNEPTNDIQRLSKTKFLATLNDLLGAGFDTTNKTLQWLMLYMARYPNVQKRVQEEIDDVIGSANAVQLKDRARLVYTDATIQEVMRMTALVPFALPKSTIKDTKLDGYDIDKDTVVVFNLHSVLHEKEFWGDPENFRPSRFITEENELDKEKLAHVIPFSAGRRRCVGEFLAKSELFIMFSTIMQRCSVVKPESADLDLEPVPGLVYSPKNVKVIVMER